MIKNSKQKWQVGETVKIGFVQGLEVVALIPTPKDGQPDEYILNKGATWYSFVPHNGLNKISAEEAKAEVLRGKEIKAKIDAENAQKTLELEEAQKLKRVLTRTNAY